MNMQTTSPNSCRRWSWSWWCFADQLSTGTVRCRLIISLVGFVVALAWTRGSARWCSMSSPKRRSSCLIWSLGSWIAYPSEFAWFQCWTHGSQTSPPLRSYSTGRHEHRCCSHDRYRQLTFHVAPPPTSPPACIRRAGRASSRRRSRRPTHSQTHQLDLTKLPAFRYSSLSCTSAETSNNMAKKDTD